LNIVFAGTPDIAAAVLQTLLKSEHNVLAVYTQPDRPKGRGKKLQASPVKQLAQEHGIPVLQPESLKTEDAAKALADLQADIMVVVAYGLLLPETILQTPKHGCINIHTSLLPKYRGPAPVQHAILNNDFDTGVTIMQMDAGLDTGAILQQAKCAISEDDTTESLLNKLAIMGADALLNTLANLDSIKPIKQDEKAASYAGKISKQDAEINWSNSALEIACAIRAYQPWPVAYSFIDGQRLRIFSAKVLPKKTTGSPGEILVINDDSIDVACGKDALRIYTAQLPGKNAMRMRDVLNGHPDLFMPGTVFHDA
jgi:methionyl-tRNA formyltransferase